MNDMFEKNKKNSLNLALSQIKKQFGSESIISMSEKTHAVKEKDVYSTGSIGLNYALGIGGLPKGRIVEIYGPESSGKTTLCLQVIAECQKKVE